MSIGEVTMFLMYLTILQMPIRGLGWMVMMVPRAATAGVRIFEILDQESDVQDRPGAVAAQNPQGHLRFRNVSFAYDPRSPVLNDIEIEAQPGRADRAARAHRFGQVDDRQPGPALLRRDRGDG